MAVNDVALVSLEPVSIAAIAVLVLVLGLLLRLTQNKRKTVPLARDTTKYPWVLQFPPSRRHTMADLKLKEGSTGPYHVTPSAEVLSQRALPTTRTPDFQQDGLFTPTGFSTEDIRALGRFPDYSVLTGVRYPEPCGPNFDINKAVFRPFRPFRWKFHQTMAHYKFEPDWWVELEKSYVPMMAARQELLKKHGDLVFFADPGTELACRELMEMLLQFVCKRYPQYFRLEKDNTIFRNDLLHTTTDLTQTPPLKVVFDNIPEDYAMVHRNDEDGFYYLRSAMVCSSVGWDIGGHRGKVLKDIHEHVPDYAEKMAFSMDRFFSKLGVDQPIQRCSWSLEDHSPLLSSPRMTDDWSRSAFAGREQEMGVEDIIFRCDYQTLRRLPLSGSVVFNFKAVFVPLTEMRDEPFVPALLAKILDEGKENLITYKTDNHVKDLTIKTCKAWAQEQVEKGLVPADWEVRTLDESPFFPGWEKKWHDQQGF